MNCREFTDFLDDYLFGNLAPAERAEFDRHLAECPFCVAYLATYRETIRLGRDALSADAPAPADAPEELIQAILKSRPRA
jgi:anti-sigma factor RsiW